MLKNFFSREFITFIIIGVINTFSTTIFASVLNNFNIFNTKFALTFNISFIIGYILGLCVSFLLNCHFTFKEKPTLRKALKFPLSYIPNFIIQYILVWIFALLSLPKTMAYLFAAALGVPITFLIMKFCVFTNNTR